MKLPSQTQFAQGAVHWSANSSTWPFSTKIGPFEPGNSTSTLRFWQLRRWLTTFTYLVSVCIWAGPDQEIFPGRIKDFAVPEYYSPPHQNQVKSLISGAQAEPLTVNRFVIRGLRAETFRQTGEREFIIEAPECNYDSVARQAYSAGPLELRTGDERLVVKGRGFLWQQDESVLIISNDVHCIIQTRSGKTFERQPMNSPEKSASAGANRQAGERLNSATTTRASQIRTCAGLLRSITVAAVALAGVAGGADQTSSLSPGEQVSAQLQVTEIFADRAEFDLKSNLAVYTGNVRVENPEIRVRCELLTARISADASRIESIVAERNVEFDMIDGRGQKIRGAGQKAVYTYKATGTETNQLVELTGDPMLYTEQGRLAGDTLVFDRLTGKITATNPRMLLGQTTTATTNQTPDTNLPPLMPSRPSAAANTNQAAPQHQTNQQPALPSQ